MRMKMIRRLGWSVCGGLLLAGAFPEWALAAGLEQTVGTEITSITPAMIPLLGAAAGIERLMELGWHYLEWGGLRFFGWRPSDLKSPGYIAFKRSTSLLAGIFPRRRGL